MGNVGSRSQKSGRLGADRLSDVAPTRRCRRSVERGDANRPERLSWLSSREGPWFSVSHDGVEDDEELSDAGDEGLLAGFPRGAKLLIVGGDDGIGSAGDQRGHVEGGSYGRSAAGDGSAAAPDAAVAIDRRHADEGRDFAPV